MGLELTAAARMGNYSEMDESIVVSFCRANRSTAKMADVFWKVVWKLL